ncbi:MAG: hypothetical protein Q4A17_07920 [Thermoguttaceae bacterium]|nr:hypothetical protein [Thermoguttaceae bacterium]
MMNRRNFNRSFLLTSAALCFRPTVIFAAESAGWTPTFEKSETFTERQLDWYTHGSDPAWGAKDPNQKDSFAVLHPKDGDAQGRPLYVVLHSAGHDVHSCLECTKSPGNHDIYHAPAEFYALYVDCRANMVDWWWGGLSAKEAVNDGNRAKAGFALSPCEKRVMATVAWTIHKYGIDPNRVYLCGNSMGGSGTLGLGLRHGDVFAAIKANVPAGVLHAASRMAFRDENGDEIPYEKVPFDQIPEPPVCIDYSAPNDGWSAQHEILFDGMKRCKYPLMAYWGNFGHANNTAQICQVNDLIESFPWTEIRKNAAYPVFTNAACDSKIPWPDREQAKDPGQVNAFFRWENVTDSAQKFEMDLWLIPSDELNSHVFTVPKETTADVSLRRLQAFKLAPNQTVRWKFGAVSGTAKTDQFGLLTLPKLKITDQKTRLVIVK